MFNLKKKLCVCEWTSTSNISTSLYAACVFSTLSAITIHEHGQSFIHSKFIVTKLFISIYLI